MGFCGFERNFALFDSTPVENLFIEEYMRTAPGDFVKVYLYALRQCYHPDKAGESPQAMADALHMDEKTLMQALQYWERQGVLTQTGNGVRLKNLRAISGQDDGMETTLYRYKAFNTQLQLLFGSRLLSPQDYNKIYDWLDVLRLPEDVVVLLVQFCIKVKGQKVSMAYIDKMALVWADADVRSVDAAETFIAQRETASPGARKVLRRLGLTRNVTADEVQLYMKWTNEWGFSPDSVLAACTETTRSQNPTFAYLDGILRSHMGRGEKNEAQIEQYHQRKSERAQEAVPVREALFELGSREAVTSAHAALYRKWTDEWGIAEEVVRLACRQCAKRNKHQFEEVDHVLSQWVQAGLRTVDDLDAYQQRVQRANDELRVVFARAGEERAPTLADRKLYGKWMEQWKMPFELVLLAAEYSVTASGKMAYIDRLLGAWQEKGIRTLEEASAEHAARRPAAQAAGAKAVHAHRFSQREAEKGAFDDLFEQL